MSILAPSEEVLCPGGYPLEDRYLGLFAADAGLVVAEEGAKYLAAGSEQIESRQRRKERCYER